MIGILMVAIGCSNALTAKNTAILLATANMRLPMPTKLVIITLKNAPIPAIVLGVSADNKKQFQQNWASLRGRSSGLNQLYFPSNEKHTLIG